MRRYSLHTAATHSCQSLPSRVLIGSWRLAYSPRPLHELSTAMVGTMSLKFLSFVLLIGKWIVVSMQTLLFLKNSKTQNVHSLVLGRITVAEMWAYDEYDLGLQI